MKKISIKESQLKRIINFQLNEALGIPNNIFNVADKITDQFLNDLKSQNYHTQQDNNGITINFNIELKDQIGNFNINSVDFTLSIIYHPKVDPNKIEILNYAIQNLQTPYDPIKHNKSLHYDHDILNNETDLRFRIAAPINAEMDFIIDKLLEKKQEISRGLSHELSHKYHDVKKKKVGIYSMSSYSALQKISFGIWPIDKFLHLIYFAHSIEWVTRPTEIGYELHTNKIKKKDFSEFLTNNDIFKTLLELKNFSLNNFKNELKKDIDKITKIFAENGVEYEGKTEDEMIEQILDVIYINYYNNAHNSIVENITSFLDVLMGMSPNKKRIYNDLHKKLDKLKNYKKFFNFYEKFFNFVGEKMIRKVSKLYDLAQMNENSIVNWEWYHIVNETNKNISTKKLK
jgi:hypothetical protein